MTRATHAGRASVWHITHDGDGYPTKGDALATAKRRAAGENPEATIISQDEEGLYVATWNPSRSN